MNTRENALEKLSNLLGLPKEEIDPYTLNEFLTDSEEYHDGHERGGCFMCKMD